MATNPIGTEPVAVPDSQPEDDGSPRVGVGKFLLIVGMAVLFFLLAQTMVRRGFYDGGERAQNDAVRQ
jgi:hypothetical protein